MAAKRLWKAIAPVCVIAMTAPHTLYTAETPEERIKKLVVMIRGKLGDTETIGAGIIFGTASDRLYIATANHVVRQGSQGAENLRVQLRWLPGETAPATLLTQSDSNLDLAVLSVQGLSQIGVTNETLQFDQLGDPALVRRSDPTHSLGYPNGVPWQLPVNEDRVSQASANSISFESAFLYPGNSGGALLNGSFELIGLVRKDEPPNGDAANIDRVVEKLKEWGFPVALRPALAGAGRTPICVPIMIRERTHQPFALPGTGETVTIALSNLYRASRGPDASKFYIIAEPIGPNQKIFGTNGLSVPVQAAFSFSAEKTFPPFSFHDRKYQVRLTKINHGCIGNQCQTAEFTICTSP